MLQVEVTRVWDATAAIEAARVMAVLAAEAAVAQEGAATLVKYVEDQATLAEREAQEMVPRVEAVIAKVLATCNTRLFQQ
jgi:hypothetical protein